MSCSSSYGRWITVKALKGTDHKGKTPGLGRCAGWANGRGLAVTFMSPAETLITEQAKALLDKAAAHVH